MVPLQGKKNKKKENSILPCMEKAHLRLIQVAHGNLLVSSLSGNAADQIILSSTTSAANGLRKLKLTAEIGSLRDVLPQEQLILVPVGLGGRVREAEETVLAARVDFAGLEGVGRLIRDGVIWGTFEIEASAVGGGDVEEDGGNVFAVWLALCEALDGEDAIGFFWWGVALEDIAAVDEFAGLALGVGVGRVAGVFALGGVCAWRWAVGLLVGVGVVDEVAAVDELAFWGAFGVLVGWVAAVLADGVVLAGCWAGFSAFWEGSGAGEAGEGDGC